MTTFSQLVDEIILQTHRADSIALVSAMLNLTLREVFFTDRNTPVFYSSARKEFQLISTVESGLLWTPPVIRSFQALETMRFDDILNINGQPTYAVQANPGAVINERKHFYYRSGDSFAIAGFGGIGSSVSLSWFEYVPSLKYFPNDLTRPANFDEITGTTYNPPFDVDQASKDAADALTTNWLLSRWGDVIAEGVRAKVWKHFADDGRARISFSLFQNLRESLYRAEATDSLRQ